MNRSTLVMMFAILAFNWGGFIALLAYGVMRGQSSQHDDEA